MTVGAASTVLIRYNKSCLSGLSMFESVSLGREGRLLYTIDLRNGFIIGKTFKAG